MKPYIVDQVLELPTEPCVEETKPQVWLQPHLGRDRGHPADLMVEVVKSGTGTAAALSGVQVAGKTGTAEVAERRAARLVRRLRAGRRSRRWWWSCWWRTRAPGGSVAAPIARQVIAAALGL